MLFRKPIKTIRTQVKATADTPKIVLFPQGIPKITAAQKEARARAARDPHLTRGLAETHIP